MPGSTTTGWAGRTTSPPSREAAEQAIAANPGVRAGVLANRAFLARAVRYLAAERGIRQFLDIGTGIPTADNTHEVAQAAAPESRIVYVDNDRYKSGCSHAHLGHCRGQPPVNGQSAGGTRNPPAVRAVLTYMDISNPRNRSRENARRQNPKVVFFISLAFALGSFGGLMFTATVVAAAASKSGYTQAHGLLRSGIVTSVTNHEGKDPSSGVGVRLGEPVNGQAVTIAHVHPLTSLKPGAAVRVLVDPKDPGYAEFPGKRYTQKSAAQVGAAAFLALFAFFAFVAARWGRMWYRQRKRSQTAGL